MYVLTFLKEDGDSYTTVSLDATTLAGAWAEAVRKVTANMHEAERAYDAGLFGYGFLIQKAE